jgi:hypothetical protein
MCTTQCRYPVLYVCHEISVPVCCALRLFWAGLQSRAAKCSRWRNWWQSFLLNGFTKVAGVFAQKRQLLSCPHQMREIFFLSLFFFFWRVDDCVADRAFALIPLLPPPSFLLFFIFFLSFPFFSLNRRCRGQSTQARVAQLGARCANAAHLERPDLVAGAFHAFRGQVWRYFGSSLSSLLLVLLLSLFLFFFYSSFYWFLFLSFSLLLVLLVLSFPFFFFSCFFTVFSFSSSFLLLSSLFSLSLFFSLSSSFSSPPCSPSLFLSSF